MITRSRSTQPTSWLLLPQTPDFRWMRSPWYPSVKLYRQTVAGDWSSVFDRVAADLYSEFAQRRSKASRPGLALIYQEIPDAEPDHCDALNAMGVLAGQSKDLQQARLRAVRWGRFASSLWRLIRHDFFLPPSVLKQ
jgi:hypothetical protein